MSLTQLQQEVDQFVRTHGLEASATVRTLDLVSEVGEIAKEILNGSTYGRLPFQPADTWAAELGDLFFSLICLANRTEVSLETALRETMHKYENRIRRQGSPGSTG